MPVRIARLPRFFPAALLVGATLAAALLARAQDQPASSGAEASQAPLTEREVDRVFGEHIRRLDADYNRRWEAFQRARLNALQNLIDEAVAKKRSDVAAALRQKSAGIEAEIAATIVNESHSRIDDPAALQSFLKDTAWQWTPAEMIRFEASGTVGNPVWTNGGLTTTWKTIDRRTVLLYISEGRKQNRYAVLTFDPDLQFFTVYGFDGDEYNPANRVHRVKRRS
ncbi:MAG TPA: hypothetical protein VGE52_00905 [Pirellulales bacterium]